MSQTYISMSARPAMAGRQVVIRVASIVDGRSEEIDATCPSIVKQPSFLGIDLARFLETTVDPLVAAGIVERTVPVRFILGEETIAEAPFERCGIWPLVPAVYVERILADAKLMASKREWFL